ncbi:hypothetical protein ABFA07_022678 [Porites harrisoni]
MVSLWECESFQLIGALDGHLYCVFVRHLKLHKRMLNREKPFECKECGKWFKRKRHLSQHKRTHTGEKPFQCKVCGKWFKRKGYLPQHKRTHTGKKPFEYKKCGKYFRMKGYLWKHIRAHLVAKERPVSTGNNTGCPKIMSCWICQEELPTYGLLLIHYDNHMK